MMEQLSVVSICPDTEISLLVTSAVGATSVASHLFRLHEYPVSASHPGFRRLAEAQPDVVIVLTSKAHSVESVQCIETIHSELPHSMIFAIGDLRTPELIVQSMRAGAKEFLECPPSTATLLDAFSRLAASRRRRNTNNERGKTYAVVNAKGGCGATTVAVNSAVSLRQQYGTVALVDFAPIGHAALHLNERPKFTVVDALRSVDRLDATLLDGYIAKTESGVQLLAGADSPDELEVQPTALARLLDLLVQSNRAVVIDLSSRLDQLTRLVCDLADQVIIVAQADVTSLWSANKVQQYLGATSSASKFQLVLNRFKKIPGFSEEDAETATKLKLIGRIPNEFPSVAVSIDRGIPVAQKNHSQISRSFGNLASMLVTGEAEEKQKKFQLFRSFR